MMTTASMTHQSKNLLRQWETYRSKNPKVRIRDAARAIDATEAQLVALGCGGANLRLRADYDGIFNQLKSLGRLLAITRNDFVVHETCGQYLDMKKHGDVGMFFRPGLDTRFFFDRWQSVFAVNENDRFSIQFFDRHGTAAHKVYLTDDTDMARYRRLVEQFRADDQSLLEQVEPAPSKEGVVDLNAAELKAAWSRIEDVHEGSRLIRSKAGGDHQLVYRALGMEYAIPLAVGVAEKLIETCAGSGLESMIFVMADAAVQSYGGKIEDLLRTGPWFNILDADFNLHLKTEGLASAWLVKKPSTDGWIHSLDFFDGEGRELMVICDNRSKGVAEAGAWTSTLLDVADDFKIQTT